LTYTLEGLEGFEPSTLGLEDPISSIEL